MKTTTRAVCLMACLSLVLSVPAFGQLGLPGAEKVAHFHLRGPLLEKPQQADPMAMMFGAPEMVSLKELVGRFKKARDDDAVKAVVLTFEKPSLGLAQIQEIRQAIEQVRAADKEVYVHIEEMSTTLYGLVTAASHISMVPTGDLWLTGIYAEQPYAKRLLVKINVDTDFLQIGEYKSAAEFLTREGPSEAAQENLNWLLDGLYEAIIGMIAEGRQISADKARALIDDGPYTPERALKAGLIDSVKYRQDFFKDLRERYGDVKVVKNYGAEKGPSLPQDLMGWVNFLGQVFGGGPTKGRAASVGIVYVEGLIMPGSEEPTPFGGSSGAKSSSIRKALNKAAKDDSVKAVVLRVDSPGGSAMASEIIWHATQHVAAKKPLIVSMGNVAGSGGYYVACGGHAIFADETTITASIGVVGGKLITTGMWDWFGVDWKEYKRGENSAILSSSHRFSEEERARVRDWMNEVYEVFKGHIADARGTKLTKPLEEMAGGRVYTGKQALDLGLVDRLGGLDDAIKYAAAQANISDYEIRVIPKPKHIFEMMMEGFMRGEEEDEEVSGRVTAPLFSPDSPLMGELIPMLERLDPLRTQAILRTLQRIELIHEEGAVTVMPVEIIIR